MTLLPNLCLDIAPDHYNAVYWAARHMVASGVSVVPIVPGTKMPAVRWQEYQNRLPTMVEVERWFRGAHGPRAFAVVTGQVSQGLTIIDLDGEAAVKAFFARWPRYADAPRVASGSGKGAHVYVQCRAVQQTARVALPNGGNIELRADGAYTLAPPSIHPSGGYYRWVIPAPMLRVQNLDDLTPWMRTLAPAPTAPMRPDVLATAVPRGVRNPHAYGQGVLRRATDYVRSAAPGAQNNALYHAALNCGRAAAAGLVTVGEAESVLYAAACANGYVGRDGEGAARRTIISGLQAGGARPLEV